MLLHRTRLCVFIVLASFCQVSKSRKPILLPNTGQIIINEGEALNITCISERPFILPKSTRGLSVTDYFNDRETFQEYNYYKENTIFNDTGWYHCIDYFPTTVDSFSEKYSYNSEESWVYVYVKSNKNFFVDENINIRKTHLHAIAGGNVVIPCRTTSPDLKPILINGNKDEVNKTSFDPRIGFTIRNLILEDSNSYKCLIETDNKVHASVNYELSVHLNRKLTEPVLRISHLLGHNFYINCTIEMKVDMPYKIDWNTPKQNIRKQIKVFQKEIDRNTLLVTSQLMVFNYKDEDTGEYECVVKSRQNIKEEISVSTYIDLKTRIEFSSKDNFYKKKKSGENVILKIKLHHSFTTDYSKSEGILRWFNPNGESIVQSPKYYMKYTDRNQTIASLEIIRLNIMDSGNYTLQVEYGYTIARKNFSLDVIGKPISLLTRTESYYPPNESTEFHCEIISNPPPNITWSFFKYPKYPSFENTTTVYLTNVTQRAAYNSNYKIESIITMPIEVSGKIKCEACNTIGCDSKNKIILVSDGLGAFGIIGPRESVIKGDNINLVCAASVYDYMNNFTWTVHVNQTEKPVNETERLKLMQHRTLFTYRSTLKLNNVQKSDAQDYFCTGEIMNTSNQETLDPFSNRATYTLIISGIIYLFIYLFTSILIYN